MRSVLDDCLRADPRAADQPDLSRWWPLHLATLARWSSPIERSIAGGFAADRVGWAFAAGYQAALRQMMPGLPDDAMAALCVTEQTGNRPRDIVTLIDGDDATGVTVTGAKRWTTLGPASTVLLVAAVMRGTGDAPRPSMRVARVPAGAAGVRIEPMPDTAFVPEVPHARVHLDAVKLAPGSLLPGDGYDDYVKPFRTLEDTHVTAAALAYLLREALSRPWAHSFAERITGTLAAFIDIASRPAGSPATHVLLSGALHWSNQLIAEASAHWASSPDDPAAARWKRDLPLFDMGAAARTLRATRAWERLASRR